MPDRAKVVKGLEWLLENMVDPFNDFLFSGYDGPVVMANKPIIEAALALLKAQEPIAPIRRSAHAQGADDVWYECGKCGEFLGVNRYSKQFCDKCGMAVKWE